MLEEKIFVRLGPLKGTYSKTEIQSCLMYNQNAHCKEEIQFSLNPIGSKCDLCIKLSDNSEDQCSLQNTFFSLIKIDTKMW